MIQQQSSISNEPFFKYVFNFLKLESLMSRLGFNKRSGVSVFEVFMVTFTSVMYGHKTTYQYHTSAIHKEEKVSRDAMYRVLKSQNYNWGLLLKAMVVRFISFITSEVNPKQQPCCLVVDDTCLERPKSHKAELLSRIWDHVSQRYIRGYQELVLGWTDGISFFPVLAKPVCSGDKNNRYCEADSKIDGRTLGGKLRKMAVMKKPEQVIAMCKEALAAGIKAEYMLFDSWFFSEYMLASLHELGLNTISMVKSNLKFALTADGETLSQQAVLRYLRQQSPCGRKAPILGETIACYHGIAVRLVFVRNRNNPEKSITIVSTDLNLSAEEIVQLYVQRWKIETSFFSQKQYFGLDSECQAHKFDTINALMQLANIRFAVAEFARRLEEDLRTMGELFRNTSELLHVLPFVDACNRLIEAVNTELRQKLLAAKVIIPGKEDEVMAMITDTLGSWLTGCINYIRDKITAFRLSVPQE